MLRGLATDSRAAAAEADSETWAKVHANRADLIDRLLAAPRSLPAGDARSIGPEDAALIDRALAYFAARSPGAPVADVARIRAALAGEGPT